MVSPTFSEFQFTYGLTRELEGPQPGTGLIDLPRIPTQNQEAELPADMVSSLRRGDARLAPLFIQYKRAEKMVRSNAGQWTKLENRGINLSEGYFRFRPYLGENEQHNKLVELGQRQPLVFYVAPMFIDHDEYREYASNEELYDHTAFIQCANLQRIADEDHYITYTPMANRGVMCSEPMTFPVRTKDNSVFWPDEIGSGLTSFARLQDEFADLRRGIIYGFDQEEQRKSEHLEPTAYDAEEPTVWMEQQQKFFRDTINSDLLFFTDHDR